jgi:hypothetical protein
MSRENRISNTRIRYGRCANEECEMCSKDVKHPIIQEISSRKEFVCEKCGRELHECLPPQSAWDKYKKLIIGGVAVIVVGGVVAGITLIPSKELPEGDSVEVAVDDLNEVENQVVTMPQEVVETATDEETNMTQIEDENVSKDAEPADEPKEQKVLNGHGTVNLGYASYTGDLKNGKPHGYGTLTYKKSCKIVESQEFVASPGDTFEGDFREGRISGMGYWTHGGNKTAIKP